MVTPARRRRRGEVGVTLVELMVTLVVASIVAFSTFVFFAGQQRIYDTQTNILNVQQNVWAAMETLTRHVRAAGTGMGGCVRPDSDAAGPDTGDPAPDGAAPPATGLRAFRNGAAIRIPPLWIQNGAAGAPDILTVAFGNGTFGNFEDARLGQVVPSETPTAAIFTQPTFTNVFLPGEFIVLIQPDRANLDLGCSLFRITGIPPGTDQLEHAASEWNPGANVAGIVPFDYTAGGTATDGAIRNFGQLNWVQFAIDRNDGTRAPTLTMNRLDANTGPQVLAEGIEDLQIAFACEQQPPAGDLLESPLTDPGARQSDDWIHNEAGDAAPAGCGRPLAYRITLIARSLAADDTLMGLANNRRPALEDSVAGAANTFRYRVITSTIYPRNLERP